MKTEKKTTPTKKYFFVEISIICFVKRRVGEGMRKGSWDNCCGHLLYGRQKFVRRLKSLSEMPKTSEKRQKGWPRTHRQKWNNDLPYLHILAIRKILGKIPRAYKWGFSCGWWIKSKQIKDRSKIWLKSKCYLYSGTLRKRTVKEEKERLKKKKNG